ncbi:protein amnionless-like [Cylas formicarius]|uniref:protein amnionless-like n=1 Tax=Cylas formicarius TaxID=197179 RepID=UPI002958C41B|nr:protein amnionless-like [Cylas formicarius]
METADNSAVPHTERLPCQNDDVIFPKGLNSSVAQFMFHSTDTFKSFKIGSDFYNTDGLQEFLDSEDGRDSFRISKRIRVDDTPCRDPTGCLCSKTRSVLCDRKQLFDSKCLHPVNPVGFCSEYKLCGGYVLMKWKPGFKLSAIKERLKRYTSDTYASKVAKSDREYIQVVFTEKTYSGNSLDEISDFYNDLLRDGSSLVENVQMFVSSPYFEQGEGYRNTISMIFGTFFGAALVFGVLFLVYSPKFSNVNWSNRLINSRPLSSYMFARYDNLEDRANIYEAPSVAGSVLSLDKSFENPVYGITPSTSTTSNETNTQKNDQKEITPGSPEEYSEIELDDSKASYATQATEDVEELLLKDL